MAILAGSGADVYIVAADDTGTAMTAEACTLVAGTTYQIDASAKRYWDEGATFTVYDAAVEVPAAAYQLTYANGKITLRAAPGGAVTVTGKYLTIAQFAQADNWTMTFSKQLADSHVFGDTWEKKTAVLGAGTVTLHRFYNDEYFHTNKDTRFVLALYPKQSTGTRFLCVGVLGDDNVTLPNDGLAEESVTFNTHGPIDFEAT